jgi:transcriptional regulator with XRE-family HTH domain
MDHGDNPLYAHFARELRRLRTKRGWSQDALGKKIGYSGEQVSHVETARARPSPEFADALDTLAFPELDGMFASLLEQAEGSHDTYRAWFRGVVDAEQRANVLRTWEPLLVPGLVQTEDYARAVFDAWRPVHGNGNTDVDVNGRLARQVIFDQDVPPSFGAVIDESVLYRPIGGPKVMHEQLLRLAEMSERPRVSLQVLPASVGAHVGLLGAFLILGFADDTPGMVYMESPDQGMTSKHPATVAKLTITYDTLRDDALSAQASREMFRKVAEETWSK